MLLLPSPGTQRQTWSSMTALRMIVAATEEEAVTGEEHAAEALDKGMK